jgi:hypothetical protein
MLKAQKRLGSRTAVGDSNARSNSEKRRKVTIVTFGDKVSKKKLPHLFQ